MHSFDNNQAASKNVNKCRIFANFSVQYGYVFFSLSTVLSDDMTVLSEESFNDSTVTSFNDSTVRTIIHGQHCLSQMSQMFIDSTAGV